VYCTSQTAREDLKRSLWLMHTISARAETFFLNITSSSVFISGCDLKQQDSNESGLQITTYPLTNETNFCMVLISKYKSNNSFNNNWVAPIFELFMIHLYIKHLTISKNMNGNCYYQEYDGRRTRRTSPYNV
jgi:hypothetical protein